MAEYAGDDSTRTEQLLAEVRARFQQAVDAESDERRQQLQALEFRSGAQWPVELRARREAPDQARPCLVIPRQEQFIKQVTNAQRRHPLSIRIQPGDGLSPPQTARILQGLVRAIEQDSHADIAYMTAYDQAVGQGLGYWRLRTEYADEMSFEQVVKICPIDSRFSVYMDPTDVSPTAEGASWGMIVERLDLTTFCNEYGVDASTLAPWTNTGDSWISPQEVQVAEYFYKEWMTEELVQLQGMPQAVPLAQVPPEMYAAIEQRRTRRRPVVWWCKVNGYQLLEVTRWPGKHIPIIRVVGQQFVFGDRPGQVLRQGMIQPSMDSQRIYNYWSSATTEAIALAPRAPFVGYAETFEGYEDVWATANTANHAYLPIKAAAIGGQVLPPPQRQQAEPAVQAMTMARQLAAEDIKATLGMYNAAVEAPGPDTPAQLLRQRAMESDVANAHYPANLAWSLRFCGVQLLDVIRALYQTPQKLRIVTDDSRVEQVQVNQPFRDQQGQEQLYDMTSGRYSVVIDAGPSYATMKQETSDKLSTLAGVWPELRLLAGDYVVGAMDVQHADDIAARMRTQVPPEALQATSSQRPEDLVAALQNEVARATQQLQQLNAYAQSMEQQNQEAKQQLQMMARQVADAQIRIDNRLRDQELKARELDIEREKNVWEHQEALLKLGIESDKVDVQAAQLTPDNGSVSG